MRGDWKTEGKGKTELLGLAAVTEEDYYVAPPGQPAHMKTDGCHTQWRFSSSNLEQHQIFRAEVHSCIPDEHPSNICLLSGKTELCPV